MVDLDGGSVHIPECVNLPTLPEPMVSRAKKALTMVLMHCLSVVLWTRDGVDFMNTASFRCLEFCVSSVFHYYLMYMGTKIAKF